MALYAAGALIKSFRREKHITQEELSEGICSISELSKIESGTHNPSKHTLEALMQRLGKTSFLYNIPVTDIELELQNLEYMIFHKIIYYSFNYNDMLEKYYSLISKKDTLSTQFYLFAKSCLVRYMEGDSEKLFWDLIESIQITIPNFDYKKPHTFKGLTNTELLILIHIATILYNLNDKVNGGKLSIELKQYCENEIKGISEKSLLYPRILSDMAYYVNKEGYFSRALSLCETGIKFCLETYQLNELPFLFYNKAGAIYGSGEKEAAHVLISDAILLLRAIKQNEAANWLSYDATRRFLFEFPILGKMNLKHKNIFWIQND